ncbi:hypothetical protein PAL_GLEAN10015915 [Pteropus alecto]|uniref:Uncharacterized protein n=1 Tax=Pteropus alecto TaxID=9402 RepID=L5KZ49_PTEAL|nr:hypothetical protein PAL_GLEAN10015915 [Pteropus alecto]
MCMYAEAETLGEMAQVEPSPVHPLVLCPLSSSAPALCFGLPECLFRVLNRLLPESYTE